jgi:hypothetical protein
LQIFRPIKLRFILQCFFSIAIPVLILLIIVGFFNPNILNCNSLMEFLFNIFPLLLSCIIYLILIIYLGLKMNLIYEEIKYIIARNIVKSLIIMYFFSIFLSITNTLFF